MSVASVSVRPTIFIIFGPTLKLGSKLTSHTFYSTNCSWITKQLFGDINFYVANMKCSYEPFIYFHGEVKGALLTSPISVHGT